MFYGGQLPHPRAENGGKKMDLMTFVTLIVLAFALVMLVAGVLAAALGS